MNGQEGIYLNWLNIENDLKIILKTKNSEWENYNPN